MNTKIASLQFQIRSLVVFFILALVASGATAIPAYQELRFLLNHLPGDSFIRPWLQEVFEGLAYTKTNFPFLLYGYDWLAFGHFTIALAFIGPLRNPVKNIWVIEFGMLACTLIPPYAFICSVFRGIPVGWTLIDCSFGVIGIIPLWICRRKIMELEKLLEKERLNVVF